MKVLNLALIGYGRSGRDIHTRLLRELPGLFRIACVVDADPQRRAMAQAEIGCETLGDYRQLIGRTKDFNFITNASFSDQHASITAELMRAGFHVLSEKPAAGSADDFAQVQKAAAETGRAYSAFQQYRLSPSYVKLKEIIASGVLGRIVQVTIQYSGFSRRWDWQTAQARSGGSLLNSGPHPVDQALDLMGFPKDVEVFCAMDRAHTFGDAEDHAKLLMRAPGAPIADVEVSCSNKYVGAQYIIQGTHGCLAGNTRKLDWTYYREEDAPKQQLTLIPLRNEKGEPLYCGEKLNMREESWSLPEGLSDDTEKGLAYYRQWYDVITKGVAPVVTIDQIALQMRVQQEAHRQNEGILNRFVKL